jgi:hypothetical protein
MDNLVLVDLVNEKLGIKPMLYNVKDFVLSVGSDDSFKGCIDYYGYNEDFMGFFESLRGAYYFNLSFNFGMGGVEVDYGKYSSLINRAFFGYTKDGNGNFFESSDDVIRRGNEINDEMRRAIKDQNRERIFSLANECMNVPSFIYYKLFKNFFSDPKVSVNYFYNEKVAEEIGYVKGHSVDEEKFNNYLLKCYGLEKWVK